MTLNQDQSNLLIALALAARGRGLCAPNPAVGAIIVDSTHRLIATGFHSSYGMPHAEVDALKKINHSAKNATLYVTLEPCCHVGKTPPCTEAIIQSGIQRVVYAYQDPNPLVRGKSEKILTEHNIQVDYLPLPEITQFYQSYEHWHQTKTPYVTAKLAMSWDAKIAGKQGKRLLLTGIEAHYLTHASRYATDAILTTAKTIIQDDPLLNARFEGTVREKHIYLLDNLLSIPNTATLFKAAKSITVFHGANPSYAKKTELEKKGIRCVCIKSLPDAIKQIGEDGIQDLWVEAGGQCFSSLIRNQLVQRALIYIAPCEVEKGLPAFLKDDFLKTVFPKETQTLLFGQDRVLDIYF